MTITYFLTLVSLFPLNTFLKSFSPRNLHDVFSLPVFGHRNLSGFYLFTVDDYTRYVVWTGWGCKGYLRAAVNLKTPVHK